MASTPWSIAVRSLGLLCVSLVFIGEPSTHAQQDTGTIHVPLTVEQVVKNVEQSNRGRSRALHRVEGMRAWVSLKYHGPLGDRDAEMVVKVAYQAPAENNLR